jgi:Protein kinase domain
LHGGLDVPGYTLVRRLDDSGGQASVHLGRSDNPPHHEAAIKIYHAALRSTRDRHRFQREVEAMERLAGDPHIIEVYATGVLANGQAYLVMRLCSGGSLATLLAERGPLSPAAVSSIGETMAETLDRAHRMGVLHRDIKPHNILLADDGSPVLADFGIVALQQADFAMTATGRWTAAYAAPELFRDRPASVRTDVYGLAATLYTLLAGRPPHHDRWKNPSPAELLSRRSEPPDTVDGVPPALMSVIKRGLSPRPEERYATAGAFAAALRESTPSAETFAAALDEPLLGEEAVAQPEVPRARVGRHAAPDDDVRPVVAPAAHAEFVTRKHPTPLRISGLEPAHPVGMRPTVQPGLLATVLGGILLLALLGAQMVGPAWMVWWAALTLLIGLTSAAGIRGFGIASLVASITVCLVVAVMSYDDSPFGSLGWALAATLIAIAAGAWGHTSAAVRLRWFAWRQGVSRRRWWGQPSVRPELTSVDVVPAARFVRLGGGTCHYAVASGSGVALVRWASWPHGRYIVTDVEVRKDGETWAQGGGEMERARRGLSIVDESTVDIRSRVFLAVDTPGELRKRELKGDLTVCHTRDLAEALAAWLAEDPYELDLELLTTLLPLAEKG